MLTKDNVLDAIDLCARLEHIWFNKDIPHDSFKISIVKMRKICEYIQQEYSDDQLVKDCINIVNFCIKLEHIYYNGNKPDYSFRMECTKVKKLLRKWVTVDIKVVSEVSNG